MIVRSTLEKRPEGWYLQVGDRAVTVEKQDLVGFAYLDVLIRHQGRELPNTQVLALVGGGMVSDEWDDPEGSRDVGQKAFGLDSEDRESLKPSHPLGYHDSHVDLAPEFEFDSRLIRDIKNMPEGAEKRKAQEYIRK